MRVLVHCYEDERQAQAAIDRAFKRNALIEAERIVLGDAGRRRRRILRSRCALLQAEHVNLTRVQRTTKWLLATRAARLRYFNLPHNPAVGGAI